MMLFTLIVPPAMSLAEAARSNVKPFADEKSGGIVVNSSGDEQWIYLQAGETFESGFADGFTLTADSDVLHRGGAGGSAVGNHRGIPEDEIRHQRSALDDHV